MKNFSFCRAIVGLLIIIILVACIYRILINSNTNHVSKTYGFSNLTVKDTLVSSFDFSPDTFWTVKGESFTLIRALEKFNLLLIYSQAGCENCFNTALQILQDNICNTPIPVIFPGSSQNELAKLSSFYSEKVFELMRSNRKGIHSTLVNSGYNYCFIRISENTMRTIRIDASDLWKESFVRSLNRFN